MTSRAPEADVASAPRPQPEGTQLKSLARGGVLGLTGAAGSAVLNFGLVLAVTRMFSRSDAGILFAATSAFVLLQIVARLGTDVGVVYFLARLRALGQRHLIGGYLRVAVLPVLVLGVAAGILLFVSAPWLAARITDDQTRRGVAYLRVLAVFVPVAALLDLCLGATRGLGSIRPTAVLDKLARPAGQLLLVVTLGSVGGTAVLAGAWVAPYAVVLPLAVAWLLTMLRRARISPGGSVGGPWGSFWRFTGPRALAGLAQIVLQRLDILLVAWFLGPADAALYTAATRFLVLGQLGNQAISAPMEPQISMALAKNDMRAARDVYATSTTWLICVTWPLFILVGVFAPLLLSWFGAGYGDAWPVTLTLSLVMLVAIGCGPVDVVLIMAGRTTWNLANTALALVVNVSMNLLLIPRMGLLGAALAWAAAVLATNLIPLLQLRVAFGLHPFRPGTILAAGLSLVCVALPAILIRWVGDEGPDTLLLSLLAGGCLYVGALWRYRRPLRLDVLLGSLRAGRRPSAVST